MKGYEDLKKLMAQAEATGILNIKEEAICEYQDMIAHSTLEELHDLANGPQKYQFYRVYGYAYGTVAAIQHWSKNSDKIEAIIMERDEALIDLDEARENIKTLTAQRDEEADLRAHFECEGAKAKAELRKAQDEIKELKAKLYDLMTK